MTATCPHCGKHLPEPHGGGLSPRRQAALERIYGALATLTNQLDPAPPQPRLRVVHDERDPQ